jgi:hypothetical protein
MRIPLLRAGLLIYIRPWFNAFKTFKSFKSIPDSSQRLERFERSVAIERLEPGISLDSEEAMLTEEQNRQLTRVGPGTPMGELFRRYWHPVAAVSQMKEREHVPSKNLGRRSI